MASTAVLAAALVAPTVAANGRYPSAQQVLFDPGDPTRVWLRATYGLVTSTNGGGSWDWVCEDAVGYLSREDPALVVARGGRVSAGVFSGLLSTNDGGCTWSRDDAIGDTFVRDLTTGDGGREVLALTTTATQSGDYELRVWRSSSEPPSFTPVGGLLSLDVLGFTLDAAPSDARRLYVSGAVWPLAPSATLGADAGATTSEVDASPRGPNGPGVLLRSRDGGLTWERRRLLGASLYSNPYIAAVHPTNPDVLYVRVRGPSTGEGYVESHLLYSDDAGDSFREVFRGPADLLGFALSPDGERVYVGLGDSRDLGGQRLVDPSALGIYEARAGEFAFTRVFEGQIGCLGYLGEKLYACGGQVETGFEVGVSSDGGRTFETALGFGGLRGPLACPSGSGVATLCQAAWPVLCQPIGVCPARTTGVDAGATDAGGGSPARVASPGDGGCRAGGGSRAPAEPLAVLTTLAVALGARRVRRQASRRRGR